MSDKPKRQPWQMNGAMVGMAKACPYKTPYERAEALVEGRKAHKTIYLCSACKKWHLSKKDGEPKLTKAEREEIILDNNQRLSNMLEAIAKHVGFNGDPLSSRLVDFIGERFGYPKFVIDARPMLPTPPEDLERVLREWEEQDGPVAPEITEEVQRKLKQAEIPNPAHDEIIVTVEKMVDMGVQPDDALRTVLNDRQRQREENR